MINSEAEDLRRIARELLEDPSSFEKINTQPSFKFKDWQISVESWIMLETGIECNSCDRLN